MSLRVVLLALLSLLLPALCLAQSSPLPGSRPAEFPALQVEKQVLPDRFVVLREPSPGSRAGDEAPEVEEGAKPGKGKKADKKGDPDLAALLGGASPWPFFAGVFDESGCRSPRLSRAALVAAAICGGKGGRATGSERDLH